MNDDCIFCKIINGVLPAYTLYEDERIIAFLAKNQVSRGHVLVIPKEHYQSVFDAPDEVLSQINVTCKKIALEVKEKLQAKGVNILNASGKEAQQSVFHLHYHVVPRYDNDGLDLWFLEQEQKEINCEEVYKQLRP